MLKYLVAMLCGISLSGSVYLAGWGSQKPAASIGTEDRRGSAPTVQAIAAAADPSGKIDVKNTKCVVTGEDVGASTATVEYQGKVYHLCCSDCVADFNKAPEKYVNALEANPGKFGVRP